VGRRRLAATLLVGALFAGIVLAGAARRLARPRSPAAAAPAETRRVPEFRMVGADGERFGSDELRGRTWVASFFFTRCKAFCPALMNDVAGLQERYRAEGPEGVLLVSFSVDPEHDGPDELTAYETQLGVDRARWKLLTGDPGAMRSLVIGGFQVPMGEREVLGEDLIDVAHSGKLVLVDGSGSIRGYYDTDEAGLGALYDASRRAADGG
jgi:protein SCO1/2